MSGVIQRYDRTENLWNEDYTGISSDVIYKPVYVGDGTFTLSTTCPRSSDPAPCLFFLSGNVDSGASSAVNGVWDGAIGVRDSQNGYVTIAYRKLGITNPENYDTMLNKGSTAKAYQPYLAFKDIPYTRLETATDTITSLPKTIIGDGQPISAYTIKGNMAQSGTPTPTTPIYPSECGERTENLWNEAYTGISSSGVTYFPIYVGSGNFTLSTTARKTESLNPSQNGNANIFFLTGNVSSGASTSGNGVWNGQNRTVTATDGYVTIAYRYLVGDSGSDPRDNDTMLNIGSTAKPYEPCGYKLPITLGGNTYPVYLSEPIRKIGDYADVINSDGTVTRNIGVADLGDYTFIYNTQTTVWSCNAIPNIKYSGSGSVLGLGAAEKYVNHTASGLYAAVNNFAIGTNTVGVNTGSENIEPSGKLWYVLTTPATESITAPTLSTSGTAETFDVDTTLKPSEVDLTYHGWHSHEPQKRENGQWV